jgi:hypothetical protein
MDLNVLTASRLCREGVNQGDKELGSWLRSNTQATVVLLANKAEKQGRAGIQSEPHPRASPCAGKLFVCPYVMYLEVEGECAEA